MSPLLTDLYQLAMMEAYLDRGQTGTAVFELFMRRLPERRGFLLAAGLEQALEYLENLRFSPEDVAWLASTRRFRPKLLEYLASFRFTGDVHAIPEGTVFFPDEPILRVTAPLPQAQLVESRLINIVHYQSMIASKAARIMLAAPGKMMVDFGFRRAHGAEAGLMAARASYVAGFAGTATVLAEQRFGIPIFGTMAHSFIQAHDDEAAAFEHFALSRPDNLTLLIDTYDTEAAARKVVALAPRVKADGITIRAVRIDSGDLIELSRRVRRILNDGGLSGIAIFASGGMDEDTIAAMMRAGAPIDGFGVGTSLTTSFDAPSLDCAYKLEEYGGLARRKRSAGKVTWPGRKQVWRVSGADGRFAGDLLSLEDDDREPGEPLIVPVMRDGRRLAAPPTLADIRARSANELERLPEPLRRLEPGASYPVRVGERVIKLAAEFDRRLGL
ncbi:MAG: nicotinate phosphoribosyltransferase [Bradyrhizobium sp.]|uniref:nicotinate phosphoribosyltransferase n=1 Tax=Bradyrhizobium sp. TaxID=376 RepID=UPI001D3537F6|nr:nicotinate phosphoribosyltransferase [Bradyrhizobium sp.]MBV9561630.1 nicotinate phosphoribosyltransferase [Bradyrhizobium sp.]